ncbi:MAG TPA: hypothetical protein VKA03_01605 [Methylovirgula sp.]|nr:hypothetical protein [Methylovirgula sp.]
MAIEALYPSRRQSMRHNPLFARERQRKRIIALFALGFGLLCFAGLRIPPSPAQAGTARLHSVAEAAPVAPKRKIRIIPLYAVPSDQAIAVPDTTLPTP